MSVDIANQLFLVYLGRPADVAWRTTTANLLNGAAPSSALQTAFYNAALVDKVFTATDTVSQLVNKIFINLGLNAGAGASSFEQSEWSGLVTRGAITKEGLAWTIFSSYLGATNVPDSYKIPVQSKLIVINSYTNELGNNPTANLAVSQIGSAASDNARAVIKVVSDQATAAAAVTAMPTTITTVATSSASTFTLTTGRDSFAGTPGDDVFVANDTTLTGVDTLDGSTGNDTLQFTSGATPYAILSTGARISNIENISVRNTNVPANPAMTVDASLATGATQVIANQGTGLLTVTNLATGAAIGIVGNGSTVNGLVTYSYAKAADAQIINVSGGTLAGTNITSGNGTPTTVTINSSTAANALGTLTLNSTAANTVTSLTINATTNFTGKLVKADFAATASLTVTGAGKVDVSGSVAAPTFKTIDASASTGGLTIGLDVGVTSFKGSSGSDVVTTAALTTTTAGVIDGGAGTDTLVVAAATDVNSATKLALYKGFETIQNNDTVTIALDGFTDATAAISNGVGGGFTKMSAVQAAAVTNKVAQTGVTYALTTATGTADVLGITLKHDTATSAANLKGATITGFETLNVTVSSGGSTAAGTKTAVDFAAAADLTAINVAGAFSATLDLTNTAKAVTVLSTQTGTAVLDVTGNAIKGSSITTTANTDAITTTAAVAGGINEYVSYNAGAGDDTVTTTAAAINNTSNANASLKIDGGAGTDTLIFNETNLAAVDANFQFITGFETVSHTKAAGTISIITAGFFDANFKGTGVTLTLGDATAGNGQTRTLDASTFTGKATVTMSNEGAFISTVKTGSGADTITLTQGAVNGAATTHVIEAGGGDDTITATNAFVKVTGGLGADKITITDAVSNADVIVINAGDSTAAARDTVTGFGFAADQLDLVTGFTSTAANVLGGGTAGSVNGVDSGTIKSHSVTASGIVTFDTVDTFAAAKTVNAANLADVLGYLAANVTTAGVTTAFAYDSDNNGTNDATIVFQAGGGNTVVELAGVVVTATTAFSATAAANTIAFV